MAKKTPPKRKTTHAKTSTTTRTPVKTVATKKAAAKSTARPTAKATTKTATTAKTKSSPPSRTHKKVAPRKRSAMSLDDRSLTHAERAILDRMADLDPKDERYGVLEAALAFKASWVILGEKVHDVYTTKAYKLWGYATFARYCADEIHVTTSTAKKLVRSYGWLDEEAPELLPQRRTTGAKVLPIPDLATVEVLADARKAVNDDRVTEDAYLALKHAALDGDKSASVLRKAFKDALPTPALQPPDPVRALRRALTNAVKTMEALREWDGSDALLVHSENLRDEIARHLPRGDELSAAA